MQIKWQILISSGFLTVAVMAWSPPANAVVYCKTAGVPKGCVVRPVAPVTRAVVYCTRPGVPVGCVARPVSRGAVNRGGPVNRVGPR